MTQSFYTLLTTTGAAKIAAVQAGSAPPVQLTHIALGDGGGQAYDPTGSETALVNEVHRTTVTSVAVDPDNPSWVVVDAAIPPDVGGWWIREAGIFDSDGDMIAIAKMAETYKPVLTDGMATDLVIRLILQVTSASAVTITVDQSQVLASRDWVLAAYPWATDAEATDRTVEQRVMDPARTHVAIDSRLANATQAADASDATHLITPQRLWEMVPGLVGSLPQAGVPSAICAADEAAALAAGLADGGLWLESDAATPTVYRYDAAAAASTALAPQPSCVWCTNSQRLWLRGTDGVLRPYSTGEPDWRSGQVAFVYDQKFAIPHPLGQTPRRLHFCYVCVTAVSYFQPGDRVWWGGVAPGNTSADAEVSASATHIYIDPDQRYLMRPVQGGGYADLTSDYDKFAIEVEAWL